MRINDAVLGAVLILFGALLAFASRGFPTIPGQEYGADVFPTLIAIGFAGTGLVLVASGVRRRAPVLEWADWARERHGVRNVLITIAAIAFYIFASRPLGFIPTMGAILIVLLRLFGVGWIASVVIAIVMTLAMLYLFGSILLVPLPWGVLTPIRWW